jgi:hypothetical protein
MKCRNAAAAIPLLTLLWSCGNDPTGIRREGESNPVISSTGPSIEAFLSPGFLVLARGQEAQLEVRIPRDTYMETVWFPNVSWHSTAPEVATVSPKGVVRALGPGTARIRATGEGFLASASVRVR